MVRIHISLVLVFCFTAAQAQLFTKHFGTRFFEDDLTGGASNKVSRGFLNECCLGFGNEFMTVFSRMKSTSNEKFGDDPPFSETLDAPDIDGCGALLPVEWLEINAAWAEDGSGALISWKTAHEEMTRSYRVERSMDGRVFEPVREVAPDYSGSYLITDPQVMPRSVFYRVAEIDFDGREGFSPTAELSPAWYPEGIRISPNPGGDYLEIRGNFSYGIEYQIIITSLSGQELHREKVTLQPGENRITLSTIYLLSGVYVVKWTSGEASARTLWAKIY